MSQKELKILLNGEFLDLKKLQEGLKSYTKQHSNVKLLFRKLINSWKEEELSRSILALNIIGQLLKKHSEYTGFVGKSMFSSFVHYSRKMNALTAGRINFMLRSVVEVYKGDLDEAYRHAFVFIRQMAIILRKGYAVVKDRQSVHNWQFIHSLNLWTQFIAKYESHNESIASLRHPLVNIIIGTIRLSPSERLIPLRFHCISMLHELSGLTTLAGSSTQNSGTDSLPIKSVFIPTIPLILDVFTIVDFNRTATRHSKTPFDLRLLLHYSPSQKAEAACTEASISWLHDLLCEAFALHATSLTFPDISYPVSNALSSFTKKCRNPKFNHIFKKLNVAITEHAKFISKYRTSIKSITNTSAIDNFRARIATLHAEQSPFSEFYAVHRASRRTFLQQLAETKKKQNEELMDEDEIDDDKHIGKRDLKDNKRTKKLREDTDDESSDDSDASYDYDDGLKVVHVSSKDHKKELDEDSDGSGQFDMEAALREAEPIEDDAISIATSQDPREYDDEELSDFNLSEYGGDTKSAPSKKRQKKETSKANSAKYNASGSENTQSMNQKQNENRKSKKKYNRKK